MFNNSYISTFSSLSGIDVYKRQGIYNAAKEGKFMSIDDMKIRSKIGKVAIETLKNVGCLKGMSQSNQMSLFG